MSERGEMFNSSYVTVPDSSWFDMSYDHIFSANFGELVPTTFMELMPKDVVHAKTDSFCRLSPLVAPTFGKVNLFSYHFRVLNRTIWTNWKSFITNADQREAWQNAASFTPPVMPYLDVRKILFNSKLFIPSQSISTPVYDSDTGIVTLDTDYFNAKGVRTLVIWYDDQGSTVDLREHAYKMLDSHDVSFELDHFNSAHSHAFFIQFIPNKNELEKDYVTIRGVESRQYYNPFSNGSLFDYLGVDIQPVYKECLYLYQDFASELGGYDEAELNAYISDPSVLGIDLREFLLSHALVSIGYVSKGATNKYIVNAGSGNTAQLGYSPSLAGQLPGLYHSEESAKINALPLRAYYFVYSEYFRDQNYISINDNVDFTRDGEDIDWSLSSDTIFDYLTLKLKAWEHDPYTTALPQAQRGDPVRFLPDAKFSIGDPIAAPSGSKYDQVRLLNGLELVADTAQSTTSANYKSISVDLSAATVENLRFATATQRFLEKAARTGNRYFEWMFGMFGVEIEAVKLDRPTYLGGDKSPVQVSEVLQTSASDFSTDQPLGAMAGRAVALGSDDRLEFMSEEHGFFIEITCAIPRVSYQQGLKPMFTRKVQLDYPFSDYAQLGEQQIRTGELYYSASDSLDDVPFGFQSRYYDWKYNRDVVSGTFKDQLNHWTWSRIFDSAPVAGRKFLEVKPDYRQFAVTSQAFEHLYCTMYHDIQVQRELPIFGIPTL